MPSRPTRAARPTLAAGLVLAATLALAACGSGDAAAPPAAVTSTAPSAAPAVSPSAAPAVSPSAAPAVSPSAAPAVSPSHSPEPSPTPGVLDSDLYPYTWALPAEALLITPTLATVAWDGSAEMGSTSQYVDRFYLPGSKLTFVFSAPTDLALEPYAGYIHSRAVGDHGCPLSLDDERRSTLSGSPATIGAFPCQNLYVLELSTVRDGVGLVIKQLAPPPDDLQAHIDAFESLVAGFRWDD